MKKEKSFYIIITILTLTYFYSCSTNKGNFILNEEFNNNKIGWVEEQTEFHYLEIKDGEYLIHSIDTSNARSSAGTVYGGYLYGLPSKYQIITSIKQKETKNENTHFGIILQSSTLEYKFAVYADGVIIVSEYDYNSKIRKILISKKINLSPTEPAEISINIDDMYFMVTVNDLTIGSSRFKTKTSSWNDLRLYASSESAILVDYIRIRKK